MTKAIYICTGGCGGKVTQEQYEGGIQTCQAKDCPKYGQPFDKRLQCEECGVEYKPEEQHDHD